MIHAFLFDIGNVLLRFDFSVAMQKYVAASNATDTDDASARILDVKVAYEDGQIDRETFIDGATKALGYRGTKAEFTAAWEDIFTLNEPMAALVPKLAPHFPLYLLSNTNDIHHDYFTRRYRVFQYFRGGTFSHVARRSKPGHEIYEMACAAHGLEPANTFFIDDLLPNIVTARSLGFHAHHYHPDQHGELLTDLDAKGIAVR